MVCPQFGSKTGDGSVPYDEEVTRVLRVDLAVAADRRRRVGRTEGQLLEDVVTQRSGRQDGVEISILAVRVNRAVAVGDEGVDAPLESHRVVAHAGHVAVRIARAAQMVGVLKAPLDTHV